jgi:septum site-determining protein MinD
MGKVIGILSLKGGVGKTSVVASLGEAISGFGKKVLLIDGNLSAPNLGMHLNIISPEITIHHVLCREANIGDAIHNLENFDIIPGLMFNKKRVNPLDLKKKIRGLKRKYDIILIDSSPALNEESLAVILASDEIFIVTTPDYPTLSMTLKSIKKANDRGAVINGLILNKVYNRNFELSLDEIEKTAEVPVMAVIPHDISVLKSLSKFKPSTEFSPRSEASKEYKKLAATLIGKKYKPFSLKNFFKITPKRQEINREIFYERVFK